MQHYAGVKICGKKHDVHRLLAGATKCGFNMVVHHIDGDKANNDPSNLQIMTRSEHSRLHGLGRSVKHRPSFKPDQNGCFPCCKCGLAKPLASFITDKHQEYGVSSICKDCANRQRRDKRRSVEKR